LHVQYLLADTAQWVASHTIQQAASATSHRIEVDASVVPSPSRWRMYFRSLALLLITLNENISRVLNQARKCRNSLSIRSFFAVCEPNGARNLRPIARSGAKVGHSPRGAVTASLPLSRCELFQSNRGCFCGRCSCWQPLFAAAAHSRGFLQRSQETALPSSDNRFAWVRRLHGVREHQWKGWDGWQSLDASRVRRGLQYPIRLSVTDRGGGGWRRPARATTDTRWRGTTPR
jgi:hypothetical protein